MLIQVLLVRNPGFSRLSIQVLLVGDPVVLRPGLSGRSLWSSAGRHQQPDRRGMARNRYFRFWGKPQTWVLGIVGFATVRRVFQQGPLPPPQIFLVSLPSLLATLALCSNPSPAHVCATLMQSHG